MRLLAISLLIAGLTAAVPAAPALARVTVPVGGGPSFADENHRTHTLYVANANDSTVSVVDVRRCAGLDTAGCARTSPVIRVPGPPLGLAVDEGTDSVYVTDPFDAAVAVIDGATCNATDHSGCDQTPATARAGAFDNVLAVDPRTHMVYTTDQGADPGTVSVIDGNECNGTDTSGCARQPIASPVVGGAPSGITINPATDTVYVANTGLTPDEDPVPGGDTLSVIDGAACTAAHPAGCAPVGTVAAGPAPAAAAVDPASDTIYVADTHDGTPTGGPGTVAVVDGSHCNGHDVSGCASQTPRLVIVGADPEGVAVDPGSHAAYVTNPNDDTVSVIDVSTCNAAHASACQDRPPAIAVGGTPVLPVADARRRALYIVSTVDNDVTVLSDRTCGVHVSFGCRRQVPTVGAGSFPDAAATDERHQTVYVGDIHALAAPFTVSMIDAAGCDSTGCARSPRSFAAFGPPSGIAVDQRTDTVYVASGGPLQVIDAAGCNATASSGCGRAASAPAGGFAVAVDASTDTVYTLGRHDDGSGYVNVIDGRRCRAGDTAGCASPAPTVTVGAFPRGLAVDASAHTLYVVSRDDRAVSVVDLRHCRAGDTGGCAGQAAPEVPVPGTISPRAIGVDHATGTAYVTENVGFAPGSISMIDIRHCRAGDTSGCAGQTPPTVPIPGGAGSAVRIDPATDTVYVANAHDSSVSVIDGRGCNAADTSKCGRTGRVAVGSDPSAIALDSARRMVFVPNFYDDDVSVFAQPPCSGAVFGPPWSSYRSPLSSISAAYASASSWGA